MTEEATTHRVVLERDGEEPIVVPVPRGTAILQAAEQAGCAPRSGCRVGRCSTCTARLEEGAISYLRPPRSGRTEASAGEYFRTCVATPTEACRVRVGDAVLAEAFPGLWGHLAD